MSDFEMIKYRKQLKIFNFALLPVTGSLYMLRRVQWTGYGVECYNVWTDDVIFC